MSAVLSAAPNHPHCPPPSVLAPVEGLLGGPGPALAVNAGTVGGVRADTHQLVGAAEVTGEDGRILELD